MQEGRGQGLRNQRRHQPRRGPRPNNLSGGHLCEGYTHGMNMVIENVRQLQRHRRLTTVPGALPTVSIPTITTWAVVGRFKDAKISMNMGWGTPAVGSSLIMGNVLN